MAIYFEFSHDVATDGMTARLFEVGSGTPVLADTRQVADRSVKFPNAIVPGRFALTLSRTTGLVCRSGPLDIEPDTYGEPLTWGDTLFLRHAEPTPDPSSGEDAIIITPGQLAAALPAVPMTEGSTTVKSISLQVGNGRLTLSGEADHSEHTTVSTPFGDVSGPTVTTPVTYEYQFTLRPATDPIALTPVVTVETIHATVRSAAGGLLGFLVDIFVNEFVALLRAEGSFSSTVQALIQETIDVQFAGAISAQPVRPTSVTVETLTIDAGVGVSVNAWGAVSTRRMCAASASGGSVRLRGRDQLSLMRRLRDELLSGSPRGRAYIATYERHNRELARLLVRNSKLLKLADRVVVGVMTDFGDKPLRAGRLSQSTADVLIEAMAAVEKDASPELALAIRSLRPEVSDFVRHRASTVLGASWPHPIGKE